jgi:hypothetical protein
MPPLAATLCPALIIALGIMAGGRRGNNVLFFIVFL